MPRIRTIKPEFFRHAELYDIEEKTGLPIRVAFIGLWTVADREGRFKWEPRSLKLDTVPFDPCEFSRVLDALEGGDFIRRYTVAGRQYGYIPSFKDHQIFNPRESASKLPSPELGDKEEQENGAIKPKYDASPTREARVNDASTTRDPRGHDPARGEREREREREVVALDAREAPKVNEPEKVNAAPAPQGSEPNPKPAPAQSPVSEREALTTRLSDALGLTPEQLFRRGGFESFFAMFQEWKATGCDPDKDIWPVIAKLGAKAKAKQLRIASPRYFEIAIFESRDLRLASLPTPAEIRQRQDEAVFAFKLENWWHPDFGPKPGDPGCVIPPDIIQKHLGQQFAQAMH